ncbi:MAG TPA: 6-phosphogluconolactonase [Candidatus Eisenbacteria bacterium]|nr:6-phosphogluconolactonase [Candidatus Eisenbacteria bacterium]
MQILVVSDFQNAIDRAKEILYEKVDRKTVLFLSGGATPKSLYASLAKDKIIHPATVGMVDERYGKKMHTTSNELMIQESGLLEYLDTQKVPFYPILGKNLTRKNASKAYDQTTRDLFFHFHKSVAVMGIGTDGHISSIIPNRKDFIDPLFEEGRKQLFVGDFNDTKSAYKERIGMTFAGLSLIDYFVVLAFGKEKKKPLQQMFSQGSLEEVPSRFFMQQAPNNTVVITDQQV